MALDFTSLPSYTKREAQAHMATLTATERSQLAQVARKHLRMRWCPLTPTATQAAFLSVGGEEMLFGGAAGPGKSTGLLMKAASFVDVPNFSALCLRQSYPHLTARGGLLDKAHQWWKGTAAKYDGENHSWNFPSGARIQFGYLEHDRDLNRYMGAEYQLIEFDELTQFPEHQYLELFGRLRRLLGMEVEPQMRSATNPGGVGHEWVRRRFVRPGHPSRPYLPARMTDNPHLDVVTYRKALAKLPMVRRRQLALGDWDAVIGGGMFDRSWFKVVPDYKVPQRGWVDVVRAWDLAATEPTEANPNPDWTAGVRMRRHADNTAWITHIARFRKNPHVVKKYATGWAKNDDYYTKVRLEQEPGAGGKIAVDDFVQALPGYDVAGIPASGSGSKAARAWPFANASGAGQVFIKEGPWVEPFLNEVEWFPFGEKKDQVDAASLAYNTLFMEQVGEAQEVEAELVSAWMNNYL